MQQVLTLLSNSMQTTLVALGELGEGGFAKVFSATCPAKPEMGAEMAVKLIKVSILIHRSDTQLPSAFASSLQKGLVLHCTVSTLRLSPVTLSPRPKICEMVIMQPSAATRSGSAARPPQACVLSISTQSYGAGF